MHGPIITMSDSLLRLLGASDVPSYTSNTVTDPSEMGGILRNGQCYHGYHDGIGLDAADTHRRIGRT